MISYPKVWLERMASLLGGEYPAFEAALQQECTHGLRINPLRYSEIVERLENIAPESVPWYPEFGRIVAAGKPSADLAHFSGAYYMQEPSAMAAVAVLAPKQGERILDLCAAPGGKSGQIAAGIGESGVLVSNEVDAERARMLAGNLERLGIGNAAVVSAMPYVLAERWAGTFDAVLCDAPCSGEGMFRRDENARSEWAENSPDGCSARQKPIIDAAIEMLRPGGRLVYSTCTFNTQENEENVRYALEAHPEMHPAEFELPGVGKSTNGCIRLWPHRQHGEGHFAAMLIKGGSAADVPKDIRKKQRAKKPDNAGDVYRTFLASGIFTNAGRFSSMKPHIIGERLFLVPTDMPETEGLYVTRLGLPVAKIGRSHLEPDHSLAMAIRPEEAICIHECTDKEADGYVRGETIACSDQDGKWVWISYRGLPLGWAKYSDGMLKNHLPKGLRKF